jgi:glutathione S-transferase
VRLGFFKFPPDVQAANLQSALGALKELDGLMAGRSWLVGSGVTIADIDIYGIVSYAGQAQIDLQAFGNVRKWMARVEDLSGFKGPQDCLPQASVKAA